ncbi:hypothetical protein [Frateuria defendens]|uniref:hypothetical protein n=1 Tax=Frateuria defendens TaxID=2219559 RepID=UPI00066FF49E|nr:hypothetical protein [Frateuria defendens]
MASATPAGTIAVPRFVAWRIGCWIVLLLAAFGGVQYLRHGDYPYLGASFAVIVVSAGCVLRQAWARQPMRLVALALAVWVMVSAALVLASWGQFEQARQHALAQPELSGVLLAMIEQAKRAYLLSLVFKALLLPLLLWLAWWLGRPAVAAQFRRRR